MLNSWFGARWFGILEVSPSNNPFHKGIPGIQTTGPQNIKWLTFTNGSRGLKVTPVDNPSLATKTPNKNS